MTEATGIIPFITIMQSHGTSSPSFGQGPQFSWIKSQAAWQRLGYVDYFKMTHQAFPNPNVIVELDFTKHDVLIFTYGDDGNNGSSIRLEKITAHGKTVFMVQRMDADQNLKHAQVMTHPLHMVRIDKGLDSQNIEFIVNGQPGTFEVHCENE